MDAEDPDVPTEAARVPDFLLQSQASFIDVYNTTEQSTVGSQYDYPNQSSGFRPNPKRLEKESHTNNKTEEHFGATGSAISSHTPAGNPTHITVDALYSFTSCPSGRSVSPSVNAAPDRPCKIKSVDSPNLPDTTLARLMRSLYTSIKITTAIMDLYVSLLSSCNTSPVYIYSNSVLDSTEGSVKHSKDVIVMIPVYESNHWTVAEYDFRKTTIRLYVSGPGGAKVSDELINKTKIFVKNVQVVGEVSQSISNSDIR